MNWLKKLMEIWGWATGARTRTLLYHSISDSPNDPFAVPPRVFQQQMSWLRQHNFQVITHSQFLQSLDEGQSLKRTLVITFDDGLEDFAEVAVPILKQHYFPAIVFIPTAKIGNLRDWNKKLSAARLLSQEQIEHLVALGFEIGSHTAWHADLEKIDDHRLALELGESLAYLLSLPGIRSPSLAYPYGRAGVREQSAARQAGYASAYLAGGLWGNGKPCDHFALTRLPVHRGIAIKQFAGLVQGSADLINLFSNFSHSGRGAT